MSQLKRERDKNDEEKRIETLKGDKDALAE